MRILLKAAAWGVLALVFMLFMNWNDLLEWYWLVVVGLVASLFIFKEYRQLPDQVAVAKLVNRQFDLVQYSTELIFEEPRNQLEAIQLARVNDALRQELPAFKYPVYWKDLLLVSVLLISIGFAARLFPMLNQTTAISESTQMDSGNALTSPVTNDSVYITETRVMVSPPAYTRIKKSTSSDLNLSIPDQSSLTWNISFNKEPKTIWMSVNGGDSLAAKISGSGFLFELKSKQSTLYVINYMDEKGHTYSTPFHEINVIADQPPELVIKGMPQFQRIDYEKGLSMDLDLSISDDYGLVDGYIVATITKGSGESVKFREQKIALPGAVRGKKVVMPVSFDLDELDMEPGNELYFYATAFDNREPSSQQSRTDTYFVILKDTAQIEFSLQGALGVDLMPDYFRSQLQIIIDTRKLIEERGQLPKKDFNFESNALGYDQKQLRLKYGQFIGEEEDSGLEIQEEPDEPDPTGDVLSEFGHDTDAENEEGQWMDRGTESHDDHEHEGEEVESPLEQFIHNHEDEETATFYTQSLKSKLRAALNEMWDAELYLRLFQPEKSLPYQLEAQKLLKEIRNHARIYVQRIGFDPPPVNVAEHRLTGKMEDLNEDSFEEDIEKEVTYPAMRTAIQWVEEQRHDWKWDATGKRILREAGNELAGLAIEKPGQYLDVLNQIKSLLEVQEMGDEHKLLLRAIALKMELAIPKSAPTPASKTISSDEYSEAFIESLTNKHP
uniref:hypothetical protein n=1 Tax=Ekhidna sp. TaxID=2608089 RepID=UPI0032EFA022